LIAGGLQYHDGGQIKNNAHLKFNPALSPGVGGTQGIRLLRRAFMAPGPGMSM